MPEHEQQRATGLDQMPAQAGSTWLVPYAGPVSPSERPGRLTLTAEEPGRETRKQMPSLNRRTRQRGHDQLPQSPMPARPTLVWNSPRGTDPVRPEQQARRFVGNNREWQIQRRSTRSPPPPHPPTLSPQLPTCRVFNLDPDLVIIRPHETVADTLRRGKTRLLPIQGHSLVPPGSGCAADLQTRTTPADCFRGFGIVRIGKPADPERWPWPLVPGAGAPGRWKPTWPRRKISQRSPTTTRRTFPKTLSPFESEADLEMQNLERDIEELSLMDPRRGRARRAPVDEPGDTDGDVSDSADATDPSEADAEDPFRGERPAIRLVETPSAATATRSSISKPAEHGRGDGLSPANRRLPGNRRQAERILDSPHDNARRSVPRSGPAGGPPVLRKAPVARKMTTKTIGGDNEVDFDKVPAAESPDSQNLPGPDRETRSLHPPSRRECMPMPTLSPDTP